MTSLTLPNVLYTPEKKTELKEYLQTFKDFDLLNEQRSKQKSENTKTEKDAKIQTIQLLANKKVECVDVTDALPKCIRNSMIAKHASANRKGDFKCFVRRQTTRSYSTWNEKLIERWSESWSPDDVALLEGMRLKVLQKEDVEAVNKACADLCRRGSVKERATIALTLTAPRGTVKPKASAAKKTKKRKNSDDILLDEDGEDKGTSATDAKKGIFKFASLEAPLKSTIETWLLSKDKNVKTDALFKPKIQALKEKCNVFSKKFNAIFNNITEKTANSKADDVLRNSESKSNTLQKFKLATASDPSYDELVALKKRQQALLARENDNDDDDQNDEDDCEADTVANKKQDTKDPAVINYHLTQKMRYITKPINNKIMYEIILGGAAKRLIERKLNYNDPNKINTIIHQSKNLSDELVRSIAIEWKKAILEELGHYLKTHNEKITETKISKQTKKPKADDE